MSGGGERPDAAQRVGALADFQDPVGGHVVRLQPHPAGLALGEVIAGLPAAGGGDVVDHALLVQPARVLQPCFQDVGRHAVELGRAEDHGHVGVGPVVGHDALAHPRGVELTELLGAQLGLLLDGGQVDAGHRSGHAPEDRHPVVVGTRRYDGPPPGCVSVMVTLSYPSAVRSCAVTAVMTSSTASWPTIVRAI